MAVMTRTLVVWFCLLVSPWAFGQVAGAQGVRLLVPYPPGGSIDQMARLVAPPLKDALRQDVLVENVPGAAGAIGLQRFLAASSDGHDLAIGTDSDMVLLPMVNDEVRYKADQFRVLGVIAQAPLVLVTGASSRVAGVGAMLAEGRADRARTWSVGNYGNGSNAHLCGVDFAQRAGLAFVHVPYKGIAPLLQDLLGSHVDLAFMPLVGPVLESIAGGKLRAVGLASGTRDARLPQVPTLAEAAALPGFEHHSWSAVVVNRSVPETTVKGLHAAVRGALDDKGFQAELLRIGSVPAPPLDLAQSQSFLQSEVLRYRRLADTWRARDPALR